MDDLSFCLLHQVVTDSEAALDMLEANVPTPPMTASGACKDVGAGLFKALVALLKAQVRLITERL